MVSIMYQNAFSEVLEYLKGINEEDLEKIPKSFMEYLKNNASKDYHPQIDYTKPLKEIEMSSTAYSVISHICYEYWCENENIKKEFLELLNRNQVLYEEDINNKTQEGFHHSKEKQKKEKVEENILPIETKKESFFDKIKKFIMRIFKR